MIGLGWGYAVKKGVPYLLSATLGNPIPILMGGLKSFVPKDDIDVNGLVGGVTKIEEFLKEQSEDNVVQNIRMFRNEFEEMMSKSKFLVP